MTRSISRWLLAAIFMGAALFCASAFMATRTHASTNLSDINASPYRTSIEYLLQHGMISGNPDGTFKPNSTMNRAEFSTMIVRAFGASEASIGQEKNCFKDVHSEWFARFVCFAKMNNLVSGHPDGTFHPTDSVSYVEAVAMAMRAVQLTPTNVPEPHEWFEPFLEFAHINNIFSRYALYPAAALTREKAAFVTHQLFLIHTGEKAAAPQRQNYSAGCGANPPSVAPQSMTVNGVTRTYITAVPSSYEKNTPLALVFAIHGRTNSNERVRSYYKVEEASAGKAIFIYPAGLRSGSGYTWGAGDYPFFDGLLAQFSNSYCVDLDKVFVVGHSLGGWFTSELACARGDVIRAVANIGGGASPHTACAGPVAAMIWHNPKDNLVAFNQGLVARDNVVAQNQCLNETKPVEPQWAHCVAYQSCLRDAPVEWCPHTENYEEWSGQYYPHTWPRNAGQEIWNFLEGLPK